MHQESYALMRDMLATIAGDELRVLDVGSLDVNGTFRPLVEDRGWSYTGLDVCDGRNVDVVTEDPFAYPFENGAFDVVISGSTMEHVTEIWRWVPELARVLAPGGWLALHTHWSFPEHRYPIDCWRILPDGMQYLLEMAGAFDEYDIEIANEWDITALARKGTYES